MDTARGTALITDCPDLFVLEAAPLAPNVYAHVDVCDSCQLVFELLASDHSGECIHMEPLIAARGDGSIGRAASNLLDRHLASCADCRAVAETLSPTHDAEGDLASLPSVDPSSYVLGLEVARGGMGRILAARDLRVGRPVAVKELLGRSRQLAARFEREARVTARLQHPGIVPIYEIGRWPDGTPFYSMRMVEGRTLREAIDAAPTLAARLALLPAIVAASEAVAFAHSQRVIHRDLTPSNVLVGSYGETVVIDWGLAKDLTETEEPLVDEAPSSSGDLTNVGAVIGTAAYMPPEQANALPVDERADVYALGAILYHLLAGRPPYNPSEVADVIAAVKSSSPPPIETVVPNAPTDLVSMVEKAMARDASARYPTARELTEELKRFQTGRMVEAHEYTTAERMKRFVVRNRAPVTVTVLAAILLLSLSAIAVSRVVRSNTEAKTTVLELLQEKGRTELLAGNTQRALAFLDAAYEGGRKDDPALQFLLASAVRDLSAVEPGGDLDCGSGIRDLAFSPDGSVIVAACHERARMWRLSDHARLADLDGPAGGFDSVSYSHDGKLIATWGDEGNVRIWDRDGHLVRTLHHADDRVNYAPFTEDDTRIVTSGNDGWARVWDVKTGQLVRELQGSTALLHNLYGLTNRDGTRLFTVTMDGTVSGWNLLTGDRIGAFDHGSFIVGGDVSSTAPRAATCGADGTVKLWDTSDGSSHLLGQLAGPTNIAWKCSFSTDGTRLLVASQDGRAYVWDVKSGAAVQTVDHGSPLWTAHFAPDGGRFATVSFDGRVKVWDTASGGLLASHDTMGGTEAKFSSDGQRLVAARGDGRLRVWRAPDGPLRATFNARSQDILAMTNDGTAIAIRSGFDVIVINPATGRPITDVRLQQPLAISTQSPILVGAAATGGVVRIDLASRMATALPIAGIPTGIATNRDGSRALIVVNGRAEVWTGASRTRVFEHVANALLAPDGKRLLAWDGELARTFDVESGRELAHFSVAGEPLAFSRDGRRVVVQEGPASAPIHRVSVWSADTGALIGALDNAITRPMLDPTATYFSTVLTDKSVQSWSLVDDHRMAFVGEQLQQAQLDPSGNLIAGIAKDGDAALVLDGRDGRLLARWAIAHDRPDLSQFHATPPQGIATWSLDGKTIITRSSRVAFWNAATELPPNARKLVRENLPWRVAGSRLVPALTELRGTVVRGGFPVSGTRVTLEFRKPPDLGAEPLTWAKTRAMKHVVELRTDSDGRFSKRDLEPGHYTITVGATHVEDVSVTVEEDDITIDLDGASHSQSP